MMGPHLGSSEMVEGGASLQVRGRELLAALYAAIRALKLYPVANAATEKALLELDRVARRVLEREGIVEVRLVGDFFFLNDARLRLDLSNFAAFSFLAGAMSRHGIGVIEIAPQVEPEEWAPFLSLLLHDVADERAFDHFERRLGEAPVRRIMVMASREQARIPEDDEQTREAAKRTYFQSINVAREVLSDARLGRAFNARRVKRAVQSIVDQVLDNESVMLGMTALRDYDEYTFTHCVNVCILSVVLGQRLGLSKLQLYELGVGALLHDIGKREVDWEITNKSGLLTEEEFEEIKEHPTEGMLQLFSMHGFAEAPFRAMLIAYEHHMKLDQSGYPGSYRPRDPTLFGPIVAVADAFDAGTSRRSYQPFPIPPGSVLAEMRDNPRRGYDPLIVRALIGATGFYPPGTLAIFDTFEMGVVVEPSTDPKRLHQPRARVIADAMGLQLAEPLLVDLAELDPATGEPRRTIIKTLDPERYGSRVADYLI
jgi:HD-GYP domain-containing protein (c-di-GMP phosphodiesterase class II)